MPYRTVRYFVLLDAAFSDSPFLDSLTLSGMAHAGSKKAQPSSTARRARSKKSFLVLPPYSSGCS